MLKQQGSNCPSVIRRGSGNCSIMAFSLSHVLAGSAKGVRL
jgi:hypothetical protein